MDVLFPSCLSCDLGHLVGDAEGSDRLSLLGVGISSVDVGSSVPCDLVDGGVDGEGGDRPSLLGAVSVNDDVGSSLSFDLGDVGVDGEGGDCPSLLGVVDGNNDDVGFVFVCRSLNAEGGVAPTSPPPLILKKDRDRMKRSHDHIVGIDPASGRLLIAEVHAMSSRSDDFRNVHHPGPRNLVVMLARCHFQSHLQFHLFFSF